MIRNQTINRDAHLFEGVEPGGITGIGAGVLLMALAAAAGLEAGSFLANLLLALTRHAW